MEVYPTGCPLSRPAGPGIGGRLREHNDDFSVHEISLFEPSGNGEHVFVRLQRAGLSTVDLRRRLARLFDIPESAVGYAGLKDRHAVVEQSFSLHLPAATEEDVRSRIESRGDVRVESFSRNATKLRVGKLAANRFTLLLRAGPDSTEELNFARAQEIRSWLEQHGVANYYGEQRFGPNGENVDRALAMLRGKLRVKDKWQRNFYLSVAQSQAFNHWLALRIDTETLQTVLPGDVLRREDSGGLFVATPEELADCQNRLARGEVTIAGPMFGGQPARPAATAQAAQLEGRVVESLGRLGERLLRSRAAATYRAARVFPRDFAISRAGRNLRFEFTLPPGSYAVVLMREFMQ